MTPLCEDTILYEAVLLMRQHLPYEAVSPNEAASLHNAASPSKAAFAIYHMILYLQ